MKNLEYSLSNIEWQPLHSGGSEILISQSQNEDQRTLMAFIWFNTPCNHLACQHLNSHDRNILQPTQGLHTPHM